MRDGAGSRRAATSNGVCLMVRMARMLLQMWRKHALQVARNTDKLNAFRQAKTVLAQGVVERRVAHANKTSKHRTQAPL